MDIRPQIYALVAEHNGPILRRVIESTMVFSHDYHPRQVTWSLQNLWNPDFEEGQAIVLSHYHHRSNQKPDNVYSYRGEPSATQLAQLKAAYAERERILNRHALGRAGERYFRSVLIESGRYERITQTKQLGKIVDERGKNALDLLATGKSNGIRYGISVKNQRENVVGDHQAIGDCFTKAMAHDALPWLVVPFATAEARIACATRGVRLTVVGRQILPAQDCDNRPMRKTIEDLRSVIGPQPYDYVYSRPSRIYLHSAAARADAQAA